MDQVKSVWRKARRPYLSAFMQKNRMLVLLASFALIISSVLRVYVARIIQQLLDLVGSGDYSALQRMSMLTLLFFIITWVFRLLLRSTRASFIRRAMRQYKDYAFSRLTGKSIGSFAKEHTSRYISALTNDCISIEQNLLVNSFELLNYLIWLIGSLAMMFWYNWKMTLMVVGLTVLPVTVSMLCGGKLIPVEKRVSERNESFVGMVKDLLSGFQVIKSFKAENEAGRLFSHENAGLEQTKYKRRMTDDLIQFIGAAAGSLDHFGIIIYGVWLSISGEITFGVVAAFVQLMNYVLAPIQEAPRLLANWKAAIGLIDKMADVTSQNVERKGQIIGNNLKQSIELDHVTFSYEPGETVLQDISQVFEVGKSYAIVGGSGSGKSTMLNLLMGSFEQYDGCVTLDGVELRDIAPESLYDLLSLIQQNVFVFDNTIHDNVTMFRDFPEDQVMAAIEKAGLHKLVEERGADYRCGENGANLSGGERQRISIARCLLRGTSVLLMDEATAALDAVTAHTVTSAILDVSGLTRIIVTHKLEENILRRFDEILVLRHGILCERGDFDALMQQKEYFYSLYNVSKEDREELVK